MKLGIFLYSCVFISLLHHSKTEDNPKLDQNVSNTATLCVQQHACKLIGQLYTRHYGHLWLTMFKFPLLISGLPYTGQLETTMWTQCNALLKMELVSMFKVTLGYVNDTVYRFKCAYDMYAMR